MLNAFLVFKGGEESEWKLSEEGGGWDEECILAQPHFHHYGHHWGPSFCALSLGAVANAENQLSVSTLLSVLDTSACRHHQRAVGHINRTKSSACLLHHHFFVLIELSIGAKHKFMPD